MAAEARKTGDQALPKRIGRYEAFLQIGAGGMARVYLAVQRGQLGQKPELVVVKILRPEVLEDEHALALFTDEARIATRLDHPNVIRTREVIAEPPDYLLAMDFHNGRSLLDVVNRIGRPAVPLDEHIYILCRVLAGLSHAHELQDESGRPFGIVHRDVSPANVLVSYGGEVKLLDFGIAKATGSLVATRDGVVRGKLGYAAPEQCLGQPADPRSDVYAVGVMLWEAIAGRRRVTGETWQSVMQARLEDSEPALEEVRPDTSAELTAIVRKAVARDPDARYSSAREFQTDLEKYLTENRGAIIGPARIAAMLRPHFEQDRADLQRSVENALRGKGGQPARIPLPGGRAASPAPAAASAPAEEHTAPIPVDSALLMLSRDEAPAEPESSAPTAPPRSPLASTAPPPPGSMTPTAPPPPAPLTTTAPPPSGPLTSTASPPPNAVIEASSAAPASLQLEGPRVESALTPGAEPKAVAAPPKAPPIEVDAFGIVIVPKTDAAPLWTGDAAGAAPQKKKSPPWPLLLLAVGAVGLGAAIVVPRLESKKSAAAASEPAAAAGDSPSPTTRSTASKVGTVKVRISVDPADATLSLDGKVLSGNPFVAVLPRDTAAHELTAVAEGCSAHQQTVRLSGDLSLLVAMKCQRQGMRPSSKAVVRRPGSAPAAAAPGKGAGTLYPVPAAPPRLAAPPAEAPGEPPSSDNPYE